MSCNDGHNHGSGFSCCHQKEFVQDKLCCDFRLTTPGPTTIYTADPTAVGCAGLFASGTIKNCGTIDITVTFLRGVGSDGIGGTVIRTVVVPAGGCATFTVSGFDAITVTAPGATPAVPAVGELCILPRYRIG
ncbi:hypothetical protein P4S83_17165 [Aneurinibacillus thermoaerophilus]|uniref:S-Ena type endospore appendage n=1 Tax=Aneurinibacillus thermoaerophilus TaxID=143495 RepID=UPI002E1B1C96|nr:hypothetical protein [Aneurinibacillus thermoaerophilus]MED0764492.1 hypothetical protein [Aneurinibacillus thermoaerophilus]